MGNGGNEIVLKLSALPGEFELGLRFFQGAPLKNAACLYRRQDSQRHLFGGIFGPAKPNENNCATPDR